MPFYMQIRANPGTIGRIRPKVAHRFLLRFSPRFSPNLAIFAEIQDFQRNFSKKSPGAVLDGRDIGTVVCPDANIKIFLTASLEARAKRRYIELCKHDKKIGFETILEQIRERDERDQSRSCSPMVAANDAKIFDTSKLSINEAVDKVFNYIQTKI